MKNPPLYMGFIAILTLILLSFFFMNKPFSKPLPNTAPLKSGASGFQIKASIPYWVQDQAVESAGQNSSSINVLHLFWYFLTSDSKIQKYEYASVDPNIISFAHDQNMKVFAVLTNLPEEEGTSWDSDRVETILENDALRQKHISDILTLLKEKQFDGIVIDYEEVNKSQRNNFTSFIKELTQTLNQNDKLVAVALHPKRSDSDEGLGAFQDWQDLAQVTNQLNIMSYGEHYDEGSPGPIASTPWIKQIISYTQKLNLPPEKLFLGIPFYGYDWNKDDNESATGLNYTQVLSLLQKYNLKETWDNNYKSPYFTYEANGDTHEVWYENARSVQEKINLAKSAKLGGVTFWHLGDEDPQIWNNLKN